MRALLRALLGNRRRLPLLLETRSCGCAASGNTARELNAAFPNASVSYCSPVVELLKPGSRLGSAVENNLPAEPVTMPKIAADVASPRESKRVRAAHRQKPMNPAEHKPKVISQSVDYANHPSTRCLQKYDEVDENKHDDSEKE